LGLQDELRYGVPVLADNVLTKLLQQAADFPDVIRIGIEFGLLALRECLSDQAASKKHDQYCSRFLFVHLRFSFHLLNSVQIMTTNSFFPNQLCAYGSALNGPTSWSVIAAGLHAWGRPSRSETPARTAAPRFRRLRCRPWHHQR